MSAEAVAWRERTCREAANACTRRDNQRDATDYEVTARAFKTIPFGHRLKWEFLVQIWQLKWPHAEFEKDGVENTWALRIAKAVTRFKRICLMGCMSSGKTYVGGAMYGYSMWSLNPTNTSVYLSTTTGEAGEARTWGAVKELFNSDRYRWGRRIDSMQLITLDTEVKDEDGGSGRDLRDSVKCVKIKPGQEGKNVVGTICGRKNEHVIWCCDEAPFMDVGILEARTTLTGNDFVQNILVGNGPVEGDPLYIDAEPFGPKYPDGWRSVNKDVDEYWPTKSGGICLYFNGDKSPNFKVPKGKPIPFPKLMNWRFKEEALASAYFEEDSPIFWKIFYGFPPSVDVPDKIITHALLEKNGCFEKAEWEGAPTKVAAGLDVGFRAGGDPCVIDFGTIGKDMRGKTIMEHERDGIVLSPNATSKEPFEAQIASRVLDECQRRNCHDLAIDISSDGGLMLQAIEKEARKRGYQLSVLGVSSLGAAEDRIVIPGEKRTGKEMFVNLVAQHWMSYRISITNGVIRGVNSQSKAVRELTGRKFRTDEQRRFGVEPKREYKKRLKHSCDFADSRVYLSVQAYKMGLSGGENINAPPKPKGDIFTDPNQPAARYQGHTSRNAYSGR